MNEIYESWNNGNISDFTQWLKNSKKKDLLQFIQRCLEIELQKTLTIRRMISYLE